MNGHTNVLDIELPEVQDRDPYAPPRSHLVKTGADTWEEVPGRRESKALLVNRVRQAMDTWRDDGYPGASDTTRRLFQFWFEEDHLLPSGELFRYYFCQREAVETIVYLFEVEGRLDVGELVQAYFVSPDLLELEILTSTRGTRSFRRYVPEIGKQAEQEIPPVGLPRYAVKMATGSGKTVVWPSSSLGACCTGGLSRTAPRQTTFLSSRPTSSCMSGCARILTLRRYFTPFPSCRPSGRVIWRFRSSCAAMRASRSRRATYS